MVDTGLRRGDEWCGLWGYGGDWQPLKSVLRSRHDNPLAPRPED